MIVRPAASIIEKGHGEGDTNAYEYQNDGSEQRTHGMRLAR